MHWICYQHSADFSDVIWNILNTGYSLSQTPSIGIVKGFFTGSGVEYDIGYAFDVIGYASSGAKKLWLSDI